MAVFLNVIPRVWNLLLYEELFILLAIEYESEQKRLFFFIRQAVLFQIYKLELFIWVLSSYELSFLLTRHDEKNLINITLSHQGN